MSVLIDETPKKKKKKTTSKTRDKVGAQLIYHFALRYKDLS